jgi:hypothetical protein
MIWDLTLVSWLAYSSILKMEGTHFSETSVDFQWTTWRLGEGTPMKLATATQPQFPRNVADFKQATDFQISRITLRKHMFD